MQRSAVVWRTVLPVGASGIAEVKPVLVLRHWASGARSGPQRTLSGPTRAAGAARAPEVQRAASLRVGHRAVPLADAGGNTRLSLPAGRYRLSADGELGSFGRCEREIDVSETTAEPVDLTVPENPTVRVDTSRILDMTLGITTATMFRQLDPGEVDGEDVPMPDGERATFRISTHEDGELLVRFVEIPGPGATLVIEGPPQTHIRARFVGPDGKPVAASLEVRRELRSFRTACSLPRRRGLARALPTPVSRSRGTDAAALPQCGRWRRISSSRAGV